MIWICEGEAKKNFLSRKKEYGNFTQEKYRQTAYDGVLM
jgi:hypothetical protein